jgi:hypothetical protein
MQRIYLNESKSTQEENSYTITGNLAYTYMIIIWIMNIISMKQIIRNAANSGF